jgi:hypothetical protein
VIRARLTDQSGRISEDRVAITFLNPAPAVSRTGPLTGGLLLGMGNLVLLPLLLLVWGLGRQRQKQNLVASARLTLKNRSNLPTLFRLEVTNGEPGGLLQFRLPKGNPASHREGVGPQPPSPPSPAVRRPQPQPGTNSQAGNGLGTDRSLSRGTGRAGGCLSFVVDTVDTFSSIPWLGTPFRAIVGQLRRGQSETARLSRMPKQITAPARRLAARQKPPAPAATSSRPEPSASVPPGTTQKTPAPAVRPESAGSGWGSSLTFTTPPVTPDQSLTLDLCLRPSRLPPRSRCYTVRLASRPADVAETAEFPKERITETQVSLAGVPHWYRHFPLLAPLAVLLVLAVDLIWLAGLIYLLKIEGG